MSSRNLPTELLKQRFMLFYLHENAHVPKLLFAHAALEAQHLRVGVRLVDVDLDLLLMPAIVGINV